MNAPHIADLWRDSVGKLTPREKWTDTARGIVLLAWHGEHPGQSLTHDEADRVLEYAYARPMPTVTLAEVVAASWQRPESLERGTCR